MQENRTIPLILTFLILLAALSACSVLSPTGVSQPTQDPSIIQATLDQAKTEAAQTVVADITLNAPVATNTLLPSETPLATNTLAATSTDIPTATLPPTFTPVTPTATKIVILNTNTPAASATPNTITCALSEVLPKFGEDFKPGAPFDAAWTIKNTSSSTWLSTEYDIRYLSGTKMHEGADNRDLPADVAADKSFRYIFDMIAPAAAGRHTETWALTKSGVNVCILSVTIDVIP